MVPWFTGRVLPGIVTAALWMPAWTAVVWISHRRLKRHITKTAAGLTAALSGKTAARPAKTLLEGYQGPRPRPPEGRGT